jgi:GT2 family glycosyltransferase
MSAPRIHILLPVHNRKATTEKFVHCLRAQTGADWHLVLIDDGSRDGTADMVRALVPKVTILTGKGDWWWGGALHQGYQWLKRNKLPATDLVLITNDDTEFEPDFLARGAGALKPRSLLLAQLYNLATGEYCEAGVQWNWRKFDWVAVKGGEDINCLSTRGLFLTVGDFLEIGGFHPVMLPHYLSDYEFTQRAHRKGFALTSDPAVFLRYDEKLTGIRTKDKDTIWLRLRSPLSIRSTDNPFYWSSFVLLASPARYVPVNLLKVWWRYFIPLTTHIRVHLSILKRRIKKLWALITGTATHNAL